MRGLGPKGSLSGVLHPPKKNWVWVRACTLHKQAIDYRISGKWYLPKTALVFKTTLSYQRHQFTTQYINSLCAIHRRQYFQYIMYKLQCLLSTDSNNVYMLSLDDINWNSSFYTIMNYHNCVPAWLNEAVCGKTDFELEAKIWAKVKI